MEQISILMPVRNSAAYLEECLDSIIHQSHKNWELIVVDDHSVDESVAIIKSYQKNYPNIFLLKNNDKGIIPALSLALSNSKGSFISRMDSDDKMPSRRLELMLQKWKETSIKKTIVTGLVEYFGENISEGYKTYENWLNHINSHSLQWQNVYRECVIASPNWIILKTDLVEMGGFENLKYPEDYHLVLEWHRHQFNIAVCEETTLFWREHPLRTSRNSENYQQEAFFKLKLSHFLEYQYKGSQLLLWGTGKKARLSAKILKTKAVDFVWMDLNPEKFPNGIQNQNIENYLNTQQHSPNKTNILLCVYPPETEKQKMESYLASLNFLLGENYWYL